MTSNLIPAFGQTYPLAIVLHRVSPPLEKQKIKGGHYHEHTLPLAFYHLQLMYTICPFQALIVKMPFNEKTVSQYLPSVLSV